MLESPLTASGTCLWCNFSLGATLFVREGINARISDNDQDDFVKNRVTTLVEGRWGLAIWRPAAFTKVTGLP